jgi:hypothetical protein
MSKLDELIDVSLPLLEQVRNRTPGRDLENWLNTNYGPGNEIYDKLAKLISDGIAEGWAAKDEVDGPHYRRSRLAEPTARTHYFSITAVYMDIKGGSPTGAFDDDDVLQGQYHAHPYGEINMVVPLDEGAQLAGLNGWQGAGWTAPDPGSRHFPETRGGAVIALFFLPAGRISYDFDPAEVPARRA